MSCSKYLPVPPDGTQIPTGELRDVASTLFDFTTARPLRDAVLGLDGDGTGRCGLDHCFVVDGALDSSTGAYLHDPTAVAQAASQQLHQQSTLQILSNSAVSNSDQKKYLRHVATLSDPVSGRQMTVHATQPGVQVYSGNWLDNAPLTEGQDTSEHPAFPHIQNNGLCLETQHFPDAVNQQANNAFFPSVILRPDETYFHQAVFTFSTII